MRTLLIALTLALLATPLALAQENAEKNETPDRPDDAAWVEDCPPDMMCAAGSEDPQPYGDEGCIECSGPVDGPSDENATYDGNCGGEVCAYDGEERPQQLGPDGCIDCMGPVDNGSNCMDGAQENETCRDDVYYMDGPTRGPEDGSCENCRGDDVTPPDAESHTPPLDTATEEKSNVPAPAVALAILALAGVALLALPRRK